MNLKYGGVSLTITGDALNTRVDLSMIKDTVTILYNDQDKERISVENRVNGTDALIIQDGRARRIAALLNLAARLTPVLWGTIRKPLEVRIAAIQKYLDSLETDNVPSLDLAEKEGDLIRYYFPDSGYIGDQFQASQHLKVGQTYTVRRLDVGSSSSTVQVVELPGLNFNTVLFCRA